VVEPSFAGGTLITLGSGRRDNGSVRILLDARDLIDLIEFNRPLDVSAFAAWLNKNRATLVLSLTNVSDFVGPVFDGGNFLEMRVLLQKLETLPLAYIREGSIIMDELSLAAAAYQKGQEPPSLDPYVSRWDETAHWKGESALKPLVGLRLDEIIYMARGTIQAYKRHTTTQRGAIERQRELPDSERMRPRDIFIDSIPRRFADHGIGVPEIDFPTFGQWLWRVPSRCLGFRLHFEAYHQLLKDRSMAFQDGDIADFAHIAALPYADVLTVDKRIADLLGKVLRRLKQCDAKADLSGRVFKRFSDLLAAFP